MHRYLPKSMICWREGYSRGTFFHDFFAGLTVAIIALPLAMALGIASIPPERLEEVTSYGLSPPAMGLYTAVVAGFLISALGGSRVQIGGPTGAFVAIVSVVTLEHGYSGLATATIMAGVIVILMGVFRFGALIKFIPYPVTTGFTSGIAVIIFSTQIKDFFGLQMERVPAEFIEKMGAYAESAGTFRPWTLAVGLGSLALLVAIRRFAPRIPGAIVAVIVFSSLVALFDLPVGTIGKSYGELPGSLAPRLPPVDFSQFRELLPAALTIAFLASIESLLSAVVADGMTGYRHKADCELVAQGVANIASIFFGGIPATGAIARTAANVKSGARTPVAGMLHAVLLLLFMLLLAPLASAIPLATLAAILMLVAWNMSEVDHFRSLLRAPRSDVAVLLATFGLTVFMDLTVAVGVGLVLASLLFMKRMADVTNISAITKEFEDDGDELGDMKDPNSVTTRDIPPGIEVYEINGPFFFGVADRLKDTLRGLEKPPQVCILRMRRVPAIDASGLHALKEFHTKCKRQGTVLLLSGVHAQPLFAFVRVGFNEVIGSENMFGSLDEALERARAIVGLPPTDKPPGAEPEVARDRVPDAERSDAPRAA